MDDPRREAHIRWARLTLSLVFTREGTVSLCGQRGLTMVDAMKRKLKWDLMGVDPPSASGLAIPARKRTQYGNGMSHAQTAEQCM